MNAKLPHLFQRKKKISLGFRPSNQVFERTKLFASDNPNKNFCLSFSVSERLRIWSGGNWDPKDGSDEGYGGLGSVGSTPIYTTG